MRHALLAICVIALFAAVARSDETDGPRLHFKVEIGAKETKTIHGWLEGDPLATVRLDHDGDGKADETRLIERPVNPRTGKPMPNTKVAFDHEDARWEIDLYGLGMRKPAPGKPMEVYFRWSVTKGRGFYAWFINGRVTLHANAEAAREARPIRLGPPFRFEVSAGQRGKDALVNIGLKDGHGSTLRLARVGGQEIEPTLELRTGEETKHSGHAEYG
ncbi:MAG: hypothetical protein ACYTDY_14465 [Planctomycetota bacterium]|jgi:hypothetical protein